MGVSPFHSERGQFKCLIIMIIEIVCGIMDSSMQAFIVAFLAGLMGVLYITDTKKEK